MTNGEVVWNDPPDHLLLGGKEVHVWRVLLDQFAQNIPKLWDVLPEDEQGRARAYALHLFYFRQVDLEDFQHIVVVPAST